MARNGTKARLFRRGDRWWADLRSFGDVGGSREPLVTAAKFAAAIGTLLLVVLLLLFGLCDWLSRVPRRAT